MEKLIIVNSDALSHTARHCRGTGLNSSYKRNTKGVKC